MYPNVGQKDEGKSQKEKRSRVYSIIIIDTTCNNIKNVPDKAFVFDTYIHTQTMHYSQSKDVSFSLIKVDEN